MTTTDFLIASHQHSLSRIRRIYYATAPEERRWVRDSYRAARASILESCMNRRASNRIMEEFHRVDRKA